MRGFESNLRDARSATCQGRRRAFSIESANWPRQKRANRSFPGLEHPATQGLALVVRAAARFLSFVLKLCAGELRQKNGGQKNKKKRDEKGGGRNEILSAALSCPVSSASYFFVPHFFGHGRNEQTASFPGLEHPSTQGLALVVRAAARFLSFVVKLCTGELRQKNGGQKNKKKREEEVGCGMKFCPPLCLVLSPRPHIFLSRIFLSEVASNRLRTRPGKGPDCRAALWASALLRVSRRV